MQSAIHLLKNYKTLFICLFLYILTQCLTLFDNNQDGIIWNVSLNHLLRYISYSLGLTMTIILCTKSKYSTVKNIAFSIFILIFFWFFLEFIAWTVNKTKIFEFKSPENSLLFIDVNVENTGIKPFWGDFDQNFGKWRLPNDSLSKYRCDDNTLLVYKTNSVGARDRERSLKNANIKKRIIFLGDSFVEGIMVNIDNRLSNILEKNTQNEHLNFGINGTSPINYYLTYKHLAKKFEHDIVIIGVLPANDFEDYADGDEPTLIRFPIYRPYWKNTNKGYDLKYSLASINQAYGSLAIHNKPVEIFKTKDSIYQSLSLGNKIKSEFIANSYLLKFVSKLGERNIKEHFNKTSVFENYPNDKWKIFSYSLEKLILEAKGKRVILLTIPTLKDVQIYQKHRKNVLSVQMEKLCKKNQVSYIDLLPGFSTVKNPSDLYVVCDGHWNERGEKLAAEILLKHHIYKKAITF